LNPKKAWRELKAGKPGRRFQARHERARGGGALRKWGLIAGGALIVLAGIVLLPLPGPGLLVIAAGALLMAEESRAAARALDWLEMKARRLAGR
jgi:Putative transmembrane protein (PGPGW)